MDESLYMYMYNTYIASENTLHVILPNKSQDLCQPVVSY